MIKPREALDETSSEDGDLNFPLFFSDWIKLRRKQLDLTQAELADRACCSVFALRKIEAGERRPSKQLAGMLAKALEIPAEDQATFIKVARGELGMEKIQAIAHKTTPAEVPERIHGNLPRILTPFVGREPELTTLAGLLQDPQCTLLTIVGVGGIGKTRLAIEAAEHSRDCFPGGAWFIPLASLSSPASIVPAIAESMGFKFQDPTDLQNQLFRHLRPKKALLLLDNAEQLVEGAAVFGELLKECPQIKLLVTSRARMSLLSEWVFEIQGLPVPASDQDKQFEAYSSVALFLQSARRSQAGFQIQEEERQWVQKICQIMEGMPLGIELSAAWVGLLPVKEIAEEIDNNLDFLSTAMGDLPERQRSMRASLDYSWKLLTPDEKLILSRLSVFHGSFSREAAQAICGASLTVLASLKNKSLLQRTDGDDLILHELIRQYAAIKLEEDHEENERLKNQHALYFIQYLASFEAPLEGFGQAEIFNDMGRVIDDLSNAWQHMVTHCRPDAHNNQPFPADLLHSAVFSLSLFYEMRCRSLEAINLFQGSVEYLKTIQSDFENTEEAVCFKSVLGHVMAYLGLHFTYINQYETAAALLETAIDLLNNEEPKVRRAQAMVMLAGLKGINGQFKLAATMGEESREVFRQAGEQWWYALSSLNLAGTYNSLGRFDDAVALYQEASTIIRPGDLRLRIPHAIGYAYILFLRKEYDEAEQILQDALPLCGQLHDILSTAVILYYLGRVSFATDRIEQAVNYFKQNIAIQAEFGQSFNLAAGYLHLGKCYAAQGDRNAALEQFQQVIRIGQAINQFHLVYYALVPTARMYLTDGQTQQALEIYLLLKRCVIEYKSMQQEFEALEADLQAALPEGKLDEIQGLDCSEISMDQVKANVLAYVQEHETGKTSW